MSDLKRVLNLLDKKNLIQLSRAYGFRGWSVLMKAEIVKRLIQEKSVALPGVLARLKTSTLKSLCRDLGVRGCGMNKEDLIDRAMVQVELGCEK